MGLASKGIDQLIILERTWGLSAVNTAILDSVVKAIGQAYAAFDSLQISMTALLIGLAVFSFGFFFALREAASWFLKIDDVKKDVRRLREIVLEMEAELRVAQSLIQKNQPALNEASSLTQETESADIVVDVAPKSAVATNRAAEPAALAKPASAGFRITH